jgi:tetratricopeptide (TPR) repeat protein
VKIAPPTDSTFAVLAAPEVCQECQSVSRLTNGLCLNCLLRGALEDQKSPAGREAFKEALAAVKSRDGDWHIADHEILDEIARGGMGVVYQAREPHSGRIVALKCVLALQGDSDHVVSRFRREAETAARLDHPNIVPIYQVGETADGFPYYTMKYATAGSLLQARGPLLQHPRQSVALMVKVARAVHYAHEKGVLHRDLKPGNVLLDDHGEPLVSDFGLARCEAASNYLTRSLASFGTPGYIAPEQADGPAARLTPAADIYSLGAMMFELLAGRPPFVGDNAFAVMKQSSAEPAPKVRTLARNADRDLERICARCLERDPADRYQSAASLADDLQNWLDDRPVLARPVGLRRRFRRWVRHNRRLAALLGAFCVLAFAAAGWKIHARNLQAAMNESLLASRSVAVQPFLDLDNVVFDRAFTETLAASLEKRLSGFGPARVTMMEPDLAIRREGQLRKERPKTQARTILTGTVRMSEGRKRVSFRLTAAAEGKTLFRHVWEETGSSSSIPAEPLGQSIYSILSQNDWSNLIHSKLDPGVRNEEANEAMTAARLITHTTTSDSDNAIALLQRAIAFEPNSSLAHAYLSMEATARTHYKPDRRFLELGKKEAERALELSPESAEAHRALASVFFQEGKFREALEEGLQTIEIGGLQERIIFVLGMTLDTLGRQHQALGWYELASRLATSPGEADAALGDCWVRLVDDEEAVRAYRRATELRPNSYAGPIGLAHLRVLEGDFDGAREICRTLHVSSDDTDDMTAQVEFFSRNFEAAKQLYAKLEKEDRDGGGSFYGAVSYRSALARAKQALGENEEAGLLLEDCLAREGAIVERQPENPDAAYRLAAVEASLGMSETSLSLLRKAITLGWVDYRSLKLDPRFDSLRQNPEFDTIVTRLAAKVAEMRTKTNTTK